MRTIYLDGDFGCHVSPGDGLTPVETDFFEVPLQEDSYVLLCSDGLSNMVDNSSIFRLVLLPGTLHMKVKALTALANQNGGKDNIAVVLVEPQRNEVRRG